MGEPEPSEGKATPRADAGAPRRITLFIPCYVDQLRPEAGIAAVELLEGAGFEVEVRSAAICCGQPFTNAGYASLGADASVRWYEVMDGAECVVVLSSSCAAHLRHFLAGDAGRATRSARRLPAVVEFTTFLAGLPESVRAGRGARTVCLHSSCHGLRDSSADRHARAVLASVQELRVTQAERADECCGFGGSFSVRFPELSVRMGHDRLREIALTGAEEVVATDVSCLLHLEGIARAEGLALKFRHIAELLRDARRIPASAKAADAGAR